jgi:DNA-binding transcriptional regulator of glucitol operon
MLCEIGDFLMDSIRRTLVHALMLLVILFALNLAFTGSQVRADQAACEQIKTDCKNAGFVLGGGARNGLLVDCFQPIVQGTAQPKSASKLCRA